MRKFLALPALALAALLTVASSASATIVYGGGTLNVPGKNYFLGVTDGSFLDLLTFTVPKPAKGFTNATTIGVNGDGYIKGLKYQLSGSDGYLSAIVDGGVNSGGNPPVTTVPGVITAFLDPTVTYTLSIVGQTGGTYNGIIDTYVTPVPGAVFLFAPALAGLAGLKRFRRKDADAVPAAA